MAQPLLIYIINYFISEACPSKLHEKKGLNNMYFVHVLRSKNNPDRVYKGFTTDLKDRLEHHNSGASKHTTKFRPWELVFFASFKDKKKALDFEKYLKTASGIAFMRKRLI